MSGHMLTPFLQYLLSMVHVEGGSEVYANEHSGGFCEASQPSPPSHFWGPFGGIQTVSKTNGYQTLKANSSKFRKLAILKPIRFDSALGAVVKEIPTRVPKQTGTKMASLKCKELTHFENHLF